MPRNLLNGSRKLAATLLLVSLTGCATTTVSNAPSVLCAPSGALKPITWSDRDTDDTIAQIKEHNAVWKAVCSK